jgi:hypothetical protein
MIKHYPFPGDRTRYIRVVEKERNVPEGCIDVYQVQTTGAKVPIRFHGVFRTMDEAMTRAIELLNDPRSDRYVLFDRQLTIAHKAAILLSDGKYHLVHMAGIRFYAPASVPPIVSPTKEVEDDSPPY